jgi:hypothetical protein
MVHYYIFDRAFSGSQGRRDREPIAIAKMGAIDSKIKIHQSLEL